MWLRVRIPPSRPFMLINKDEHARFLDQKYQDGFKNLKPEDVCPPCPSCNGKMEPWDLWLVTGADCTVCGWSMTEGTGCLL